MSEKVGFGIVVVGLILAIYWMLKDSNLSMVGAVIFTVGLLTILVSAKQNVEK